jgi:FixJ family two-component response regulator
MTTDGKKIKIMCVDDDEGVLKSLERVLTTSGYQVLLANSGLKALEILSKEDPLPSILIVDQRMPGMTGSEFLRIVRDKHIGVMAIMLSGYSDFDSLVSAMNDGEIFRFVSKPWNNQMLLEVIAAALGKKRVHAIAEALSNNIKMIVEKSQDLRIETNFDEDAVTVKVLEDGKVISGGMMTSFLDTVFDAMGLSHDERIQKVSGAISKGHGSVMLVINVGEGLVLKIVIPQVKE